MMSRRQLLRTAGGVAVALPFLEVMSGPRPARAAGALGLGGRPKRFWYMHTAQGVILKDFKPTGTETNFTLPTCLKPLEPWKSELLLVYSLFNRAGDSAGDAIKGGHEEAAMTALTGVAARQGGFIRAGDGRGPYDFGGPSLDQVLARAPGADPNVPILNLGARGTLTFDYISAKGPGQPIPNEDDPLKVYNRLFSGPGAAPGAAPDAPALAAARRRKGTVLDAVKAQIDGLKPRVSSADVKVLDSYFEGIRALEVGLDRALAPSAAACVKGQAPRGGRFGDQQANFDQWIPVWMDLALTAFHCDRSRVVTNFFERGSWKLVYRWLGHTADHHLSAHANRADIITPIDTWWARQMAYMVKGLAERKEAGGMSLLDNTVALWGHELAVGTHRLHQMPYVLAGRAGGSFRTGRFLDMPGRNHNDLLLAIAKAFGVPGETFGTPSYCRGPLPLG
jgi:hypothetical protein